MQAARPPFLRGILLLAALAAIAFVMARGDSPAQATTYDPHNNVSVSDPSPGASADISIQFSLDAPDSFPNVRTNSSIQFLPRAWDIAADAPVGGIGGTFNAVTTLGIFGYLPCGFTVPVNFTMIDATTDTSNLASALDLGGSAHPGGMGFSGQFVDDPATLNTPGDLNLTLRSFNANEKFYGGGGSFADISPVYRDVDGSGKVSVGDVRLSEAANYISLTRYPAGSVVQAGDDDVGLFLTSFPSWSNYKHDNADGNTQMDPGEKVYRDMDLNNKVSYGDQRLFVFGQLQYGSTVTDFALPGGVSRYPDFLNQIFPPSVVGDPLARQFGQQSVLGTPVPLNIVTYRPGQLPGYPATLGYANVVILLNPVAPIEIYSINLTSDLCTPLSLTSTNFGLAKDNPTTLENEGGHVRLTNPKSEKDHVFTLVTTSQPDADNDNVENMLDSCPLTPNINDNGRGNPLGDVFPQDPDVDGLDAACDPQEVTPPDLGLALLLFNANEKCYSCSGFGNSKSVALYRDNDGSGRVSAGDDRLFHGAAAPGGTLATGVVQTGDGDIGTSLSSIPAFLKHVENVAENGRYDAGENIYFDSDGSNDVSLFDERRLYEGNLYPISDLSSLTLYVLYCCPSPPAPVFYIPDEDQDNYGNRADNCPQTANGIEVLDLQFIQLRDLVFNLAITGDNIPPGGSNQLDSDGDDIGDACDPDPYTITGHMHVVTVTQGVPIFKHGVKLNNLGGPKTIKDNGARTYSVDVSNLSDSAGEDVQVALRVPEGSTCATVNGTLGQNTAVVSVGPGGSGSASFTVDFTGCSAGEYTIQADACHAGDAAPAGFFGSGACPGTSDGMTDPNPLDDAPVAKSVEVGSP